MNKQESASQTNKNLTVNTLEEAEKEIYRQLKLGKNFRDISKITFLINDSIKRFNPSQIHKIKNKFEPKINESNLDLDKARVFKLFKLGVSPTNVLIKTGLSFDYIKKSREEYLEFQDMKHIPKHILMELFHEAEKLYECYEEPKFLLDAMKDAVKSYFELKQQVFPCCYCNKPLRIAGRSLDYARNYLSQKWHHKDCTSYYLK